MFHDMPFHTTPMAVPAANFEACSFQTCPLLMISTCCLMTLTGHDSKVMDLCRSIAACLSEIFITVSMPCGTATGRRGGDHVMLMLSHLSPAIKVNSLLWSQNGGRSYRALNDMWALHLPTLGFREVRQEPGRLAGVVHTLEGGAAYSGTKATVDSLGHAEYVPQVLPFLVGRLQTTHTFWAHYR